MGSTFGKKCSYHLFFLFALCLLKSSGSGSLVSG